MRLDHKPQILTTGGFAPRNPAILCFGANFFHQDVVITRSNEAQRQTSHVSQHMYAIQTKAVSQGLHRSRLSFYVVPYP